MKKKWNTIEILFVLCVGVLKDHLFGDLENDFNNCIKYSVWDRNTKTVYQIFIKISTLWYHWPKFVFARQKSNTVFEINFFHTQTRMYMLRRKKSMYNSHNLRVNNPLFGLMLFFAKQRPFANKNSLKK